MAEWIERVDRGTNTTILNEHVLRYAFAVPLIHTSSVWADLGCGTGAAAAEAVRDTFGGRLILVDKDAEALNLARREFELGEVVALEADLANASDLRRIKETVLTGHPGGHRCITCFEVVEHLEDFEPLISQLVELAEEYACTIALSVPNDAFTGVDNPYHETVWGEASVEELRSLLPHAHVFGAQYPFTGSCIHVEEQPTHHEIGIDVATDRVPSHFLLLFGPRSTDVRSLAGVTPVDLDEQRAWERRRESDLDYYRQWAEELASREPSDRPVSP